jgi:hypothetical protein
MFRISGSVHRGEKCGWERKMDEYLGGGSISNNFNIHLRIRAKKPKVIKTAKVLCS